jgi:hypothetical protein
MDLAAIVGGERWVLELELLVSDDFCERAGKRRLAGKGDEE